MASQEQAASLTHLKSFREKVTQARRQTGRLQRELASALGINPQVLSRKLHGTKQAFPTHAEVKQIVKTLVAWDAITTQAQAIELLSLMGLKAESFSQEEWNSSPLNQLEALSAANPDHRSLSPSLTRPSVSRTVDLPIPLTSLFGRKRQAQQLLSLLEEPSIRLLTLSGMGGVGKTRLALEVAHSARPYFPDGIVFVPLAALRDAALIPATLVQALHVREARPSECPAGSHIASPTEMLKQFLRDKKLLLILDNVEQLPDLGTFIHALLSSTQFLKIMVTSRTVLHLYGEYDFAVPPLDTLSPEQVIDLDVIRQSAAICLFVERVKAIEPAFQLNERNAVTIVQICNRLDGLPLAIELAAARTKVLPLAVILQRLTDGAGHRLGFLYSSAKNIPQRHQTLYETLNWSYELLNSEQQRLLWRLGIFAGGWTAQAAMRICWSELPGITLDDVFEQIEALLDHSLVRRMPFKEGREEVLLVEPRFSFLETIHEYALERLEESGEREEMQRRHALYYLELVESIEPVLFGPEQARGVALLTYEQDNLRSALTWAFERGEAEIALRMCGALRKFWTLSYRFREAQHWIDIALQMNRETSPAIRAKLIMAASRLALWCVSCERSLRLAEEALAIYEEIDDPVGKAQTIFQIGDIWHMQGEYGQAQEYLMQSVQLLSDQKDWSGYSFALSRLGAIAILQGNFPQAWTWLNEALPLLYKYGEPGLLNVSLIYLGILALAQGNLKQSMAYVREGLFLAQRTGNRYILAMGLIVAGCLLGASRDASYTARICSAAEKILESLHTGIPAGYRVFYDTHLMSLKAHLDEALWERLWQEGSSLSEQDVLALVLEAGQEP